MTGREVLMNDAQAYQQCLEKLIWAWEQLQIEVDLTQLSQIADLIVQPMMGIWRFFHTPQHIFEVGGEQDAIEVLAALFHDLVYVQVDRSINFNVSYYITPFTTEVKGTLQIREQAELPADSTFEMVMSVFGFVPAQELNPFGGQNEFLSALVAAKALEPCMKPSLLVQIVTCIEATIPFRSKSEAGLTPSEQLHHRLQVANHKFNLHLTEEEMQEAIKKAVRVANRDVGSFAHKSPAHFLANTWNLLPETNHNLIGCSYKIRDYRVALQKMEGFMQFLKPEVVFREFKGEPNELTYQGLESRARKNIEIARVYLGSKLVAIALVEAISLSIGLDVTLATMMGELPDESSGGVHLKSFIPDIPNAYPPKTALEREVLYLLEKGRAESTRYDLENSPLATLIAKSVGFDEIQYQCKQAKEFFKENISAADFISEFNLTVTEIVIEALLKLFDSRKSAISRYYYGITSESKPKAPTNSQVPLDRTTDPAALDIIKPCPQD